MLRKTPKEDMVAPHIWRIDRHLKYGIDTSAAIWDKKFLQNALAKEDCNAWQFEVNYCREAESEYGLQGEIFFDDRQPFNISPVEVVRLGKLNPDAIRFYKKLGYRINTKRREIMTFWQKSFINLKMLLCDIPLLGGILKYISKLLGVKYFS